MVLIAKYGYLCNLSRVSMNQVWLIPLCDGATLCADMSFILCVCAYVTAFFCGGGYVIIIWLLRNARYGGKSTARGTGEYCESTVRVALTYGGLMGYLWVTYGRPMGDLWATYGRPME